MEGAAPFAFIQPFHSTKPKTKKTFFLICFHFICWFSKWNGSELKSIITVIWRQYSCCMFMEWKDLWIWLNLMKSNEANVWMEWMGNCWTDGSSTPFNSFLSSNQLFLMGWLMKRKRVDGGWSPKANSGNGMSAELFDLVKKEQAAMQKLN